MFNVRLVGGHLYGKQLFTWLSLVVSLMASFVLSFFPLDVLDEIWDLIESVSEGFLTYFSYNGPITSKLLQKDFLKCFSLIGCKCSYKGYLFMVCTTLAVPKTAFIKRLALQRLEIFFRCS